MPDVLFFDAITPADAPRVGGKGGSLARTFAAGLPVPPGFVIPTDTYRRLHATGLRSDAGVAQAVLDAYRRLGGGPVAVRSSATAEDGADASFAGQQETVLGVVGDDALIAAVERCWASLHTDRAAAYRKAQGIDETAMAVVVQALVPADVAGVLFTRDPHDPTGERMAVEASWGLGEAVVSGRVTPDRFRLGFATGAVLDRVPGRKTLRITAAGEEPVPPELHAAPCLSDAELSQLADLGRKVEAFFGGPRDVEWAIANGVVYLLQARPITTATAAEREAVRADVIETVRKLVDPRGSAWVRYNLSEVLPEPTPMTWAVVGRLLAADGGFGAMNRDLGAAPDPALGSLGAFDLIAGRPMMNLARAPRLQFARPPFEYPIGEYRSDPRKAADPKPVLNPWRDGVCGLVRLPGTVVKLTRMMAATRKGADTFAAKFTTETAPAFDQWARRLLADDWSRHQGLMLTELFRKSVEKTLVEFARESLKPTVYANLAWETLAPLMTGQLGAEKARAAVGRVALGARPPEHADFARGVGRFAAGDLDRSAFLDAFGHRCRNEMELSHPRWSEDLDAVARLSAGSAGSPGTHTDTEPEPFAMIADELGLNAMTRAAAEPWAEKLRTYLGLRELAKHTLLLGYAVVRRALVELDTQHGLRGGVFFLRPEELRDLIAGADVSARITERKKRRQLELSLEVPAVLFGDDLDAIGRPLPPPDGATVLTGVALSAGVVEAACLVTTDPSTPAPDEPFVLVCPSTDPDWVPLFARAKGLVMETGGVLSHGAIVAREFGLPAVAGLPDATRQLRTGQRVRVDGGSGTVSIV